jgi:hypothetical protein
MLRILWYLLYIPMGFALAMTMCFGLGLLFLLVDIFLIISWAITGENMDWEFPVGFWVFMYGSAALRMYIGHLRDWDWTNLSAN